MAAIINRKMSDPKIEQIMHLLVDLPPAKIIDVRDYVLFLRNRYGAVEAMDDDNAWSEEDIRDLGTASMRYAVQSVWGDPENG